jgi:hypothetical protein
MKAQPTATIAGRGPAAPPDGRHQHTNACVWDVEDCRWQCTTYPLLRYALEHCTPTAQTVDDTGPGTRS